MGSKASCFCRTPHIHQTRSITHNQLRHTSFGMIFALSVSSAIFNHLNQSIGDGHVWETLLASVSAGNDHQSVTTFTNEDVQHEFLHLDRSHRILRRILLHCSNNQITIDRNTNFSACCNTFSACTNLSPSSNQATMAQCCLSSPVVPRSVQWV